MGESCFYLHASIECAYMSCLTCLNYEGLTNTQTNIKAKQGFGFTLV